MADSERSSDRGSDQPTGLGGAMLLKEQPVELDKGSVLDGRYQIRRVVGKGATGVVLEADDRVSRSVVAIKVFKPEIATDARWEEIVGSELRHARKLQHPNVCRVFDADAADGYRFLTLEYASGGSLRTRLSEVGAARPIEERIADARAVVDGLAAIHAAGIIHRDMKPDNVLRMEDGRLVVTDFGLAVAPGQTTFYSGYSGAVGTPSYMAPEVAMGGDATPASDVYSLGVILHEIFFGRRPEWDVTKRGRFLKTPLHKGSTRIEKSMARLCAECLQELAPRRPQNAGEVQAHFAKAVVGRYGTFVGALRAGKWGIVAGATLALFAAGVAWRATRPRGTPVGAVLSGEPRDLTASLRVIAEKNANLHCLEVLPGSQKARVIFGKERQAEDIDLRTGAASPSPLLPETYRVGCPRVSPHGRSLLFSSKMGAQRGLMLASNPEGRDAVWVGAGHEPRWLPNGIEFIYAADNRRGMIGALGAPPRPMPDVVPAAYSLLRLEVDPSGGGAVLAFGATSAHPVFLVRYALPSLEVLEQVTLPVHLRFRDLIGLQDGKPSVVVQEEQRVYVGTLSGGKLHRAFEFGGFSLIRVVATADVALVQNATHSVTLWVDSGSAVPKRIAEGTDISDIVANEGGDVLLSRVRPDGRRVISLLRADGDDLSDLTAGPNDREPAFVNGARSFVYVDRAKRSMWICPLSGTDACRHVRSVAPGTSVLSVAPGGGRVAFVELTPAGARLRVASIGRDDSLELSPVTKVCRPRWRTEHVVSALFANATGFEWIDFDVRTGQRAGRTEIAVLPDGRSCPPDAYPPRARARPSVTTRLSTQSVYSLQPKPQ